MKLFVRLITSISFIFIALSAFSQKSYIRFEHLSLDDGLSQATVYDIVQDKNGFMWFATEDGVNRYNGYDFKIYHHDPKNPKSLSYKRIFSLYVDKKGTLWVGTLGGGLCKYNEATDDFTVYKNDPENPNSIQGDIIQSILEDASGNFWIGTAEGGLNLMDREKGTFTSWKNKPDSQNSLSHNVVRGMSQDEDGLLWLATNGGGLNSFDYKTNTFTRYAYDPNNPESLSDNELNSVYCDKKGKIYVATAKNGLSVLDKKTGKFTRFKNNPDNPNSIAGNQVMKIFEDSKHNIWLGTFSGLSLLTPENVAKSVFINYYYSAYDAFSISNNYIRAIYEDKQGILWFGTYQDGVNKYVRDNKNFTQYKNHINNPNSLINNTVRAFAANNNNQVWVGCNAGGLDLFDPVTENFTHLNLNLLTDAINCLLYDSLDNLWIGLGGGGLLQYNTKTKQTKKYTTNDKDKNSISSNYVKAMIADKNNNIWIATSGNGLNKFDPKTKSFTRFQSNKNDTTSLAEDKLMTLAEDKNGFIWIGYANKGLDKFDKVKGVVQKFRHSDKDHTTLSNNRIHVIYESRFSNKNYIWVGTGGGGVNKIDPVTGKIEYYTIREGLPSDIVYGILEDKNGVLWMSTNYGLCQFDPNAAMSDARCKRYNTNDGLQANAFSEGAFLKTTDGNMYFGGVNGFNVFNPLTVKTNPYIPPVLITNFMLFNKEVGIGENSVLKQNIIQTKHIDLTYSDYIFSFEFAALNYMNSGNNKYKAMLEGFDKTWTEYSGKRRFVTYTNLPAGEYTFKVQASNNDGIWNPEVTQIEIHISPPFWKTNIFYISVILLLAAGVYYYIRSRTTKLEEAKRILEEKVAERTAEIRQQKEEIMAQAEQLELTNKELEKLSIVASETDNAVFIFDENGDLEWVNDGFTRMYGYTFDEYIVNFPRNLVDISTNEHIRDAIKACIEEKKSIGYETSGITKEGKMIWVHTTLTPYIDSSTNKIKKMIALDTDITDMKTAEQEILKKNEEIMLQKDILQRQNEDIRGSIRYALTIQEAILPMKDVMDKIFDSFIIYKPKDIVSGDFYWFSDYYNKQINAHIAFMAVVDCTGHGVPGAFMSLIGNRLLNEIVNEQKVLEPAQVLELLSTKIVTALKQNTSDNNDGMDVCLCSLVKLDNGKTRVHFAGAKRPLYHWNKQNAEINVIKGTSRTIGGIRNRKSNEFPFVNNELILEAGDMIYLSTDGITDQNNSDRKRLGTDRLLDTLRKMAPLSVAEQETILTETLSQFQGTEQQRDDITFMGVKIM